MGKGPPYFFLWIKLFLIASWWSIRWRRSRTGKMHKIDNVFVRVGLQVWFYSVCSKMLGLPCGDLAASIIGCNMINSPRKPRSSLNKKYYKTGTPNVIGGPQLLFYKLFCKVQILARRDFLTSGGLIFLNIYENHSWVRILNCSKFHWN